MGRKHKKSGKQNPAKVQLAAALVALLTALINLLIRIIDWLSS